MTATVKIAADTQLDGTTLRALLADLPDDHAKALHGQLLTDLIDTRNSLAQSRAAGAKDGIFSSVHVLKSLSGTVGAEALYQSSLALWNRLEAGLGEEIEHDVDGVLQALDRVIDEIALSFATDIK